MVRQPRPSPHSNLTRSKSFDALAAVIYNFNVDVLPEAAEEASKKNISIRPFNIIYRFLEDVKTELNSRVPPKEEEEVTGELCDGPTECLLWLSD